MEKGVQNKREVRTTKAEMAYQWLSGLQKVDAAQFADAIAGEFGQGMAERYAALIIKHGLWEEVIPMALSDDDKLAFRSTWALDWAYSRNKSVMEPYTEQFLETYLASTNGSVHRSFSKMLCDMLRRGTITLDESRQAEVAEKCFDLLIDESVRSAVKIWSAEILYQLMPRIDWIAEHLEETLVYQLESHPSPAIITHYDKLLKKLRGCK